MENGDREHEEQQGERPEQQQERPEQQDGRPEQQEKVDRTAPRMVLAIASGKGGVGKSLLAASVGIYLAQLGKRVVLVDADLNSANLHTHLGVDEPRTSLQSFLRKDVKHIEEVVAETPFSGLGLVPGHDNGVGASNFRATQKKRLLDQLRTLQADYVVVDLPTGSDFDTLDLFLAADVNIVLTVPEPTSIESTFRLIKSAFIRKISVIPGLSRILEDLKPRSYCGIPTPYQIQWLARERNPQLGEALHQAMALFKPRLVVNKIRARDDLELGRALCVVGRRHLALPMDYLGYVENDDMVWVTVRKRRPLLVEYPEAKVCRDIQRVARRMLSLENKEHPECTDVPKALHEQNHYEILGLHPGAIEEEVRRAQRRVRRIYSQGSAAIFGIAPPGEVDHMHRLIDAAYATLVDPEKRHLYNQNLFPEGPKLGTDQEANEDEGAAMQEGVLDQPPEAPPPENLPNMPPLAEDTQYTGDLLRQVRQARGVELQDIAERTKISMNYLKAIEEEDFFQTPAPVYLRGFIKTVARELRLNPKAVADSYMERYEPPPE